MIDFDSETYNGVYSKIFEVKEKYNFMYYKESEKEYIEKWCDTMYLMITTNMSFLEIEHYIRNSLKYRIIVDLDIRELDFVHTVFKVACLHFGFELEDIKQRYSIPYEEVEERMLYRIEMYKENWDIKSIEKYIFNYLLKTKYIEVNEEYYTYYYNNLIKIYYGVKIPVKNNKKGRPSLPKILKNHSIEKHKKVIKENMRKKYELYYKLKDLLLTDTDTEIIESKFEDKNDPLLLKIKKLNKSNYA